MSLEKNSTSSQLDCSAVQKSPYLKHDKEDIFKVFTNHNHFQGLSDFLGSLMRFKVEVCKNRILATDNFVFRIFPISWFARDLKITAR